MNPETTLGSRIYIISNREFNRIKIGVSKNPERRKADLETSCGCKLYIEYTSFPLEDAYGIETTLHDRYIKNRIMGEWFEITILPDILSHMLEKSKTFKLDRRSDLYIQEYSISAIALNERVSRAAIIKHLKAVGVYKNKGVINVEEVKIGATINEVVAEKIGRGKIALDSLPQVILKNFSNSPKRIAKNLYATNKGYLAKQYKKGGIVEETYCSYEELCIAYPKLKNKSTNT